MKDILFDVIKGKKTKRVPWVPFVGVHGGYLIGSSADEYLKSSDKIFEGISVAIQRYRPDGIPVAFDLQIEAEVLGCKLMWSKNSPPSVSSHPLEEGTSLDSLKMPSEKDGRIPIIMEALKRLKEKYKDIAFYGLVTGPLTLAMHLAGTDLLMNMLLDPQSVEKVISFSCNVAIKMSQYYSKNGADVIAIVDPTVSLISPQTFDQFMSDAYTKIFEFIKSQNKISASFVCGDARKVIEPICKTYPDSFHADENVPLSMLRDTTQKYGISFGGNIPLTTVLFSGNEILSQKVAAECIYESGIDRFVLAPGCDLLYDTPPQNLEAVSEVVHDVPMEKIGEYITEKASRIVEEKIEPYKTPNYKTLDYVNVDVITINADTCAACKYMVEAVKSVGDKFMAIPPFEWSEHRLSEKTTLSMIKTFGLKQIPSIVIDGEVAFEGIVPTHDELVKKIREAFERKKK
ncbi:MAG: thioredoxin family protein [Candidatus Parvarchaeota archaeon]|nr:thioredoxin family protein [Candidatus Jingweiarchaeum tengchongense]